MEYWEAYESTILVQKYRHLKACNPLTNKHSIAIFPKRYLQKSQDFLRAPKHFARAIICPGYVI